MATIYANYSFNQLDFNLNNLLSSFYDEFFYDNVYYNFEGIVYQDIYEIQYGNYGEYSTAFGGSSFSDRNGTVSGTVTGILNMAWSSTFGWEAISGITGISVSASSLVKAIRTASTADDEKLMISILSKSDTFILSDGNDTAHGYGGNDVIYSYAGDDFLNGGVGNDTIYAGDDNDVLVGGAGRDVMYSGYGFNAFVFTSISDSSNTAAKADALMDFDYNYDMIDLSEIDAFAKSKNINDEFVWRGTEAFSSATEGEIRYQQFDLAGSAEDYTMIWIDNDKDSGVEMAIRLAGLHQLSASDFIL